MINALAVLVIAGEILPGSKDDIFFVMNSAGYDHFPHPVNHHQFYNKTPLAVIQLPLICVTFK